MSEQNPWTLKPSQGGDIPDAIEAGNYPAVLVALVDLGIQESDFQGNVSFRREIFLAWEIPGLAGEDRLPVVLGKSFAAVINSKSNLGKWLANLSTTGQVPTEGIDLTQLLGKPCLLQVAAETKKTDNGERTYNRLVTVSRLVKGMPIPKGIRQPVLVNLRDDVPDWLPRSYGRLLKDIRDESVELNGRTRQKYEDWKRSRNNAPAAKTPASVSDDALGDDHRDRLPPGVDDDIPF